jgi:hypothetical protein
MVQRSSRQEEGRREAPRRALRRAPCLRVVGRNPQLSSSFDSRAMHARTLLPEALASVPFGFVLVRVRVRLFHVLDNLYRAAAGAVEAAAAVVYVKRV